MVSRTPTITTQKGRVLELLATRGSLCISDVPDALSYTLRNRISELRREGKAITTTRCTMHDHGMFIARYTLIPIGQQEIAL